MRVAVTGATGHIGSVLVRRLVRDGWAVRALVHGDASVLDGLDVERMAVDVRDADAVRAALEGVDVVLHLAALISLHPEDEAAMRAVNVDGVRHVAEAALAVGVRRMVHVSSVHAYRTWRLAGPLREDGVPSEASDEPAYDRSKAAGERELRRVIGRGLDAVILNPVGVVGPGDHGPSLMGRHVQAMYRGHERVLPDGGFCWIDVRDVVDAIIAAIDRGATGENYLLSAGHLSATDFQEIALRARGASPWAVRVPVPLLLRLYRLAVWVGVGPWLPAGFTPDALYALDTGLRVDASRARRELGIRPRRLDHAVEDAIAWWQDHGMLPRRQTLAARAPMWMSRASW